jgi:CRISPR-associated protein Csb2
MLVISLQFPAKRFHATPWGRQVNEGAVEWPPSPWRLLRALVATWHHKHADVPESDMQKLIECLSSPPAFQLPPASVAHTRHYMPVAGDERTKVFDTFITVDPEDAVTVIWRDLELAHAQLALLDRLLDSLSYLGRAESWVTARRLETLPAGELIQAVDSEHAAPGSTELVRTLCVSTPEDHAAWFSAASNSARARKLQQLVEAALKKGKPADKVKLSARDEAAATAELPESIFAALHADTTELRKGGWNQPPGSRWLQYARPADAFAPVRRSGPKLADRPLPTVARLAVCGPVRPPLTEAIAIGERARTILMGCSKRISGNAATVFSGKSADGSPLNANHQHAHFLCESDAADRSITHLTIFAPMGFGEQERVAIQEFARYGIWGRDGYDMQLVLLGIGQPSDFGGLDERAGQSPLLDTASTWVSRTPLVITRHISNHSHVSLQQIAADERLVAAVIAEIRRELTLRPALAALAPCVQIEPQLTPQTAGTVLGGSFTSWIKFRTERHSGRGRRGGQAGIGCRITFCDSNGNSIPVTGPISLGYGCHFGLGAFVPELVRQVFD